jgi:hypothetical protein
MDQQISGAQDARYRAADCPAIFASLHAYPYSWMVLSAAWMRYGLPGQVA